MINRDKTYDYQYLILASLPLFFLAANDWASTFFGSWLIIISLVLAVFIYFFFYDTLFSVFSHPHEESPYLATERTKSMMGAAALVIAILLVFGANRIVLHSRAEIIGVVTDRDVYRRKGPDCYLVQIDSQSEHCVDPKCWKHATIGHSVKLSPKTGMLGFKMIGATCNELLTDKND